MQCDISYFPKSLGSGRDERQRRASCFGLWKNIASKEGKGYAM